MQGSSTACVLALQGATLHAANLGDSGFMVVRRNKVHYKSRSQQHQFNFPYQLGRGGRMPFDSPAMAEVRPLLSSHMPLSCTPHASASPRPYCSALPLCYCGVPKHLSHSQLILHCSTSEQTPMEVRLLFLGTLDT